MKCLHRLTCPNIWSSGDDILWEVCGTPLEHMEEPAVNHMELALRVTPPSGSALSFLHHGVGTLWHEFSPPCWILSVCLPVICLSLLKLWSKINLPPFKVSCGKFCHGKKESNTANWQWEVVVVSVMNMAMCFVRFYSWFVGRMWKDLESWARETWELCRQNSESDVLLTEVPVLPDPTAIQFQRKYTEIYIN